MSTPRIARLASIPLALAAALAQAAPPAGAPSTLQVSRMCACQVTALSADGTAATGFMNGNFQTFRWTEAHGAKPLGRSTVTKLQGQLAGVPAISDDGRTIAATIMDDSGSYGTEGRWILGSGWQQLRPLPPDGGLLDSFDSSVFGMSGDGRTVTGLYWRPGQSGGLAHGSVWTPTGGMIGLPTDGGSSRVDGANRDGSVLVGWEEDPQTGARRAVVWKGGGKTFIDDGGGIGWPSEASAVNADGTIVVGQAVDVSLQQEVATMWKWDGKAWQKINLGLGPGSDSTGSSYALGLSDDGSTVVGTYRTDFDTFSSGGFVWSAAAGVVDAQEWLKSNGVDISRHLFVYQVPAISRDGRRMAFLTQRVQPPFADRSLLVQRLDGARLSVK